MSESLHAYPPVLAYHDVAGPDGSGAAFERQMAYLRRRGYHSLTPAEFVDALRTGTWADRSVFITADDAYLDFYELAFPVLQRFGFTATVFLISEVLERGLEGWTGPRPDIVAPLMGWDEVRAMDGSGIFFGSHGVDHRRMTAMNAEEAAWEASHSKRALEDGLGHPIELFAYPYGSCCDDALSAVREAGYEAALGLTPEVPEMFEVPRREIVANRPAWEFALRISPAYPLLSRVSGMLRMRRP